jgi:hypothetical protein
MSVINGGGTVSVTSGDKTYDLPRLTLSDIETIRNTIISGLRAHAEDIANGQKLPAMDRAVMVRDGTPAYVTRAHLVNYLDTDAGARQAVLLGMKRAGIAAAEYADFLNNLYFDVANNAAFQLVFGPPQSTAPVAST